MKTFNIYLTGVGGQGIGLLSELIIRAADYAGQTVKGVDTHGLAQRGGIVVSQLRMGNKVYTPLIPQGQADLVIALERHEALRGLNTALKDQGTLIYFNTIWQPLEVRMNQAKEVAVNVISQTCLTRNIKEVIVSDSNLPDIRMQNVAVLKAIDRRNIIPNIETDHYKEAMEDLLHGSILNKNMALFEKR